MDSPRIPALALGLTLAVAGALAAASAARATDFRLEKHLPLAAGGSFALSSEAGGVTVRGGDAAEAVVVVTSTRDDFAELYNERFENPTPDRVRPCAGIWPAGPESRRPTSRSTSGPSAWPPIPT